MTATATEPVYFLLVDDLEENLLALSGLLRREGLVTLEARSGQEALELVLKHDVALALVDIQMPGMDGFELAELMRGTERTRRVPIIFVTAGTDSQKRRFRGYEAGAVDFLQKPIEPDILKSKADVFFELYRQRQEVARLLNETREYAQSLKDADRRKDEFLATLAHELRNPLAPICNSLNILRMSGQLDPAAERVAEMMERQVNHMVRLVDDLLEVSRITRGKIELRKEPIEIAAVVRCAIETSRPLIDAASHQFMLTLPPEPITVEGDLVRLAQVFANLLNNAAKYTAHGGQIWLEVTRENARVRVSVRDTGAGIPAEMLPRVFDLFTQVDAHSRNTQGGLGIGLALVRNLVEMHGGTVEGHSEGLGCGSEFVVRLPLALAAKPHGPRVEPSSYCGLSRRRILVVDDNRDAADSLAMLLKLLGAEVITAYGGPEALKVSRTFRPQVVLLDIGMPDMNGHEVARRLRNDPESAGITIVALTGWGQDEDRQLSQAAGFDHHLVKPLEFATLQTMLSSLDGESV